MPRKKLIDTLRHRVKTGVFTSRELKVLWPESSPADRHNFITRALESKELIKLKRGVYLFPPSKGTSTSKFVMANKLLVPSYVSFQSALSWHGLIPEAVKTTTSARNLREEKTYDTPLGQFSYRYVPVEPFFLAVDHVDLGQGSALVASPIRALFDMVYASRKRYRSIEDLELDLRVDLDALRDQLHGFMDEEVREMARVYRKRHTHALEQILLKELK